MYEVVVRSNTRLNRPRTYQRAPGRAMMRLEQRGAEHGASDSAAKAESNTEIAMVKANCLLFSAVR